MKSYEQFNDIYENIIKKYIKELEKLRNEAKLIKKDEEIFFILIYIMLIIFFILLNKFNWVILVIIIFSIICILIENKLGKEKIKREETYKLRYKNTVINDLIKSFDERLEYSPGAYGMDLRYQDIYFEKIFSCNYEDKITGNLDIGNLCMANIKVYDNMYKASYSFVTEVLSFSGMLVKLEINKSFSNSIYLKTKSAKDFEAKENLKTKILVEKLNDNKKSVEDLKLSMESEEFEKNFQVYSLDRILALRIFTSDVLIAMLSFYEEFDIKFDVLIKDNNIYMRFETGNIFEAKKLEEFSLDKRKLYEYYRVVKFVLDFSTTIGNLLENFEE